jgi:sugar diacid utilization regulator
MPLDALQESYLIGQRITWEAIVAAAGDTPEGLRIAQELTAWTFRYTHVINVAVAEGFLTESHALASEVERGRRDLLDRLLSGQPPGPDEERRAEGLGLRPGAAYAVVVGTHDGTDSERLAMRAIAAKDPFVVARGDEIVAIVSGRSPSEVRSAIALAADEQDRIHGVRIRAGVSTLCQGLAELGRGYAEARRALRHADPAAALEEISLFDYLAESADETAQRLAPPGLDQLASLAETLEAYAACDLNVARSAEYLDVHPNTVHYRLRRVQELTGRDPRKFADLVELTTALRLFA